MRPRTGSMEREVKLSVPEGFRRPPLGGLRAVSAGPATSRRYTTAYHDSGDLVLAAWGCSLRFRSAEGWTVKLPALPDGQALARPEHTFEGPPDTPPAQALALVAGYLRGRAVVPVARARTTRRSQRLAGADGRPVLEVVDDTVTPLDGSAARRLRQLEVELLDPSAEDALETVLRRLRRAGARAGDPRTKYEWLLADRRPVPEVVVPHLDRTARLSDAITATIGHSVSRLLHADAATRAGDDPEAVHDARVAARRLRSDLRSFADVLEADWSAHLRAELEWAGDALGAVRDPEVLALRLEADAQRLSDPAAALRVVDVLRADRAAARSALSEVMSGARYLALLDALVHAARAPLFRIPADVPALDLLAPAVDRAWRRLRKAERAAEREPTDDTLHRLRIRAKQARYAAESLTPLLGKQTARFARRAMRLQDVLGRHQDAVVASVWLRERAVDADAFVAGELAGIELAARQRAREEWPDAWQALRQVRPSTWR